MRAFPADFAWRRSPRVPPVQPAIETGHAEPGLFVIQVEILQHEPRLRGSSARPGETRVQPTGDFEPGEGGVQQPRLHVGGVKRRQLEPFGLERDSLHLRRGVQQHGRAAVHPANAVVLKNEVLNVNAREARRRIAAGRQAQTVLCRVDEHRVEIHLAFGHRTFQIEAPSWALSRSIQGEICGDFLTGVETALVGEGEIPNLQGEGNRVSFRRGPPVKPARGRAALRLNAGVPRFLSE